MAKETFLFEKLTIPKNTQKTESTNDSILGKYETEKLTRVTIQVGHKLQENVKDYAYWLGMSQEQVIVQALEKFMSDKKPNPRPDLIKARKIGRPKGTN